MRERLELRGKYKVTNALAAMRSGKLSGVEANLPRI